MMKTVVQVDFPYTGPFGQEMATAMAGLAQSIADEPGFIWKIWTENPKTGEAGGLYLFKDPDSAQRYLEKHTARLQSFGISDIRGRIFAVNEALTTIDRGPV
ncbi:monooxygenase [Oceanimonas baumannii]|uniref:Monooxygenase ydhR n=2 Tax=Oceanimonas baumannii TaxID=129578 RepID=A0ABY2EXG2_9GAMM|nr:monooxygenase [Oceanimonas baumannii]TDW58363.1 putative monooxygenase ydhR [Oceanimonas baumannii]